MQTMLKPNEAAFLCEHKQNRVRAWPFLFLVLAILIIARLSQLEIPLRPHDEGLLLTLPDMILRGFLPCRDFEAFYGPACYWIPAAAYKIFGTKLLVERAVALSYECAFVSGIFALMRSRGLICAIGASSTAVILFSCFPCIPQASLGNFACQIWSIYFLYRASRLGSIAAGLLAGLGLLFRPEATVIVGLSALPFLIKMPMERRLSYGGGLTAAIILYVSHCMIAGFSNSIANLSDAFATSVPMRLPLFAEPALALFQSTLVIVPILALAIAVGTLTKRRADGAPKNEAVQLLALSLLSITYCLPYAFSRADYWHCFSAGCLPLSLLPACLVDLQRNFRPSPVETRSFADYLVAAAVCFWLSFIFFITIGHDDPAHYFRRWMSGQKVPSPIRIEHDGRYDFVLTQEERSWYESLFATVDRISKPGQKLFIGPQDFRRTCITETSLYYLFPRLSVNSYYAMMFPGICHRPGLRLIANIDSSDLLILTSQFDNWNEPNESRRYGSDEANREVARRFVLVARIGRYAILKRRESTN